MRNYHKILLTTFLLLFAAAASLFAQTPTPKQTPESSNTVAKTDSVEIDATTLLELVRSAERAQGEVKVLRRAREVLQMDNDSLREVNTKLKELNAIQKKLSESDAVEIQNLRTAISGYQEQLKIRAVQLTEADKRIKKLEKQNSTQKKISVTAILTAIGLAALLAL